MTLFPQIRKKVLILLFCAPAFAFGYDNGDSASWCFSVTPQYLFVNCTRTDVEKRLSYNNWIDLGEEFYFGNNLNRDNSAFGPTSTVVRYHTPINNDILSGAGLVISDKISLRPRYSGYSGFYFNYGIAYSQENIGFQDNAWTTSYQQNGVVFYYYTVTNGNLNIKNYTGFMAFGFASEANGIFHFDINLGGAYQYSNITATGLPASDRNYNRNIFDYAYNGFFPLLTFQFAFAF